MLNFTPEEKKVVLFLLSVAFCGIVLNHLIKLNCPIRKLLCADARLVRIDLNKISLEQLLKTKCLSQKTSQRIIAYRLQHGNFSSLEALKEIKGIGEQRSEKLKEIFFVE